MSAIIRNVMIVISVGVFLMIAQISLASSAAIFRIPGKNMLNIAIVVKWTGAILMSALVPMVQIAIAFLNAVPVVLNTVKLILITMSANVLFVMRQYVMITPGAMIRFVVFAIRTIVKIILLLNVVPILRIVIRRPVKFVKLKYAVYILNLIQ